MWCDSVGRCVSRCGLTALPHGPHVELIAPLDLIDKAQFQLRKVTGLFHTGSPLDAGAPCPVLDTNRGGALHRPEQVPQAVSVPTYAVCRVCRTSVWC